MRLAPWHGQRPVFRDTRNATMSLDPACLAARVSVTTLGWQATVNGRNVKHLWHFGDDGSITEEGD